MIKKILLIACIGLVSGCMSSHIPQIIKPTPNFAWEPPSKETSKNLNIALVKPSFGSGTQFRSYKRSPHKEAFLNSLQTDLERTLLAKGFTVTGPFEDFEMMTFPNKKEAALALIPEFILVINENTRRVVNSDGTWISETGTIVLNGFIKFTVKEPLSEQKIWIKKINVPEQTRQIDVDLMYSDMATGRLNQFNRNRDNKEAELVNMLNNVYPLVMKKFWDYLDSEEIEMMRKASLDARKRKGF